MKLFEQCVRVVILVTAIATNVAAIWLCIRYESVWPYVVIMSIVSMLLTLFFWPPGMHRLRVVEQLLKNFFVPMAISVSALTSIDIWKTKAK